MEANSSRGFANLPASPGHRSFQTVQRPVWAPGWRRLPACGRQRHGTRCPQHRPGGTLWRRRDRHHSHRYGLKRCDQCGGKNTARGRGAATLARFQRNDRQQNYSKRRCSYGSLAGWRDHAHAGMPSSGSRCRAVQGQASRAKPHLDRNADGLEGLCLSPLKLLPGARRADRMSHPSLASSRHACCQTPSLRRQKRSPEPIADARWFCHPLL